MLFEVPYTPMLCLLGMFHTRVDPSAWCPAQERRACEYLAEYLLGTRDDERFEPLVTGLLARA
ncbi:hypothetical protein [Streptomyces antibioticus]|uniref:hypothetical protein n=1 Tax=Streptomyces antibioticus TaxID=1890 RepID=UPI0033BB1758